MGNDQSNRVMLNKRDAAEYLGVTPRAVNRYVERGRLKVTHLPSPNGGSDLAFFHPDDLDAFKNAPREPVQRDSHALVKPVKADTENRLLDFLEARGKATRAVPIEAKLSLTLAGAAELSGYSKDYLRKAIKEGKLKAAIRGRGWNIKRDDLEGWVKKL